jgi:hypothetical protein
MIKKCVENEIVILLCLRSSLADFPPPSPTQPLSRLLHCRSKANESEQIMTMMIMLIMLSAGVCHHNIQYEIWFRYENGATKIMVSLKRYVLVMNSVSRLLSLNGAWLNFMSSPPLRYDQSTAVLSWCHNFCTRPLFLAEWQSSTSQHKVRSYINSYPPASCCCLKRPQ